MNNCFIVFFFVNSFMLNVVEESSFYFNLSGGLFLNGVLVKIYF